MDTLTLPKTLTARDLDFFHVFGFLRIPGLASESTMRSLAGELDSELREAFGDTMHPVNATSGRDGFFVPVMTGRAPTSLEVVDAFAPLAETLLGRPVLPSYAEASVYFGPTPWHLDSGSLVGSVRFILYLDPLEGPAGALLFLPGSHHPEYRMAYQSLLDSLVVTDESSMVETMDQMPTHVLVSRPGDLLVLDERVWHCSRAVRRRRQWGMTYVTAPRTPREAGLVRRFFKAEFQPASVRGYDGSRFPYYDSEWLRSHGDCMRALDELGATAAAAASARE